MNTRTALIGAALVVVAIILFVVLRGGGDDEDTQSVSGGATAKSESGQGKKSSDDQGEKTETIPTVVVGKDGKPVGGVTEITVKQGDQVHFKVKSAVAEEIHVHGYDLMKDVEAGGTVSFDFPAEIEGIFEAELEGRGEEIVELKVEP